MNTFKSLYDWWRDDNCILPEGEEMPSAEERRELRLVVRTLSEVTIDAGISAMTQRGWFKFMGEYTSDDFRQWLDEIRVE